MEAAADTRPLRRPLASAAAMLHPTYQHLEDRIRLAGLSLLQWAQLFACAVAAFGLSKLLPLPGSWSVSVAVTVCGLPAAAAVAFMQADFDVRRWLLDAVGFRREPRRFAPGVAEDDAGAGQSFTSRDPNWTSPERFDLERLWDPA
jgi:hypothetical protein